MRFSANENFPSVAVAALRQAGHDVFWVRTDMGGATDEEVLAHAISESRVLLTFDKDFGELVFQLGLPATCGIILFRIPTKSPNSVAVKVLKVIESRDAWSGMFSVVTNDRIRIRPLPS